MLFVDPAALEELGQREGASSSDDSSSEIKELATGASGCFLRFGISNNENNFLDIAPKKPLEV